MNAKHTPGPWLLADDEASRTVFKLNRDGVNRFYLFVQAGHDDDFCRTSPDELQANARLIASAPELLEALEAVLEISMESEYGRDRASRLYEIGTYARHAIAKALGEQA